MCKFLIFIIIFFFNINAYSQIPNIGKIISYKKTANGIEGKTTTARFALQVYNENIIRIRIAKNKNFNAVCYALLNNEKPIFTNFTVTEKENKIFIATNSIITVIEKIPSFRIKFKNKNAEIINEDAIGEFNGTTFNGEKVSVYKKLQEGERFVGLGEALGNLDRKGSLVTLNNTDTYKYGDNRLPMYSSIPFYIGLHHQLTYGIFYNNTYKTLFNFGASTPDYVSVAMDGGDADYFFMYDTSIAKILEHYSSLTGRMPLPPKWSIGYHQSRADYYQDKALTVAKSFRNKKIPIDCVVLDAEYEYGYEPFRIDSTRFPSMHKLTNELAAMNIEVTASVYPGIHIDSSYKIYTDGLQKDVFIKYADGKLFKTAIDPLKVYLPDYTNPKTRNWWKEKMKWLPDNGINGFWNDMNEPAVAGSYLPDNLLFDFDGRKANAAEAKNIYAYQMARSSYESGLKNLNGKRPFVLTRSGFAGVQRYASMWSGDNTASDDGLLSGVLLNSTMGLSGMPFVGPDLGGYIGDGNMNLFRRWIEVGMFSPFVRNHKGAFTPDHEPWAFGDEVEKIAKNYIGFRYQLMPYIYSKFYEASQNGMPITRSLSINYPFDEKVYDNIYQYEFLFGDAILVVPITTQENNKKVYLPKGDWYNLYTDEKIIGAKEFTKDVPLYEIPLFVKASSIIPVQSLVQSAKDKASDTLQLHIYNGTDKNSFVFYEDDGATFNYQKNNFAKRLIIFDPNKKEINFTKQEGNFSSVFKYVQIIFHGFGNEINNLQNSKECSIKLFDVLNGLQDYYKEAIENQKMEKQKTIFINYSNNEINIKW